MHLVLKKSIHIFNNMSHASCMQGNWGDSWLLMVRNQITNLTPIPAFDYNLYFKCPKRSCKPILEIYIRRGFQWFKKLFNPMGFDPYNYSLKVWKSIELQLPKWELIWECEGSFPHISLHSREHEMWLSGFPLGSHLYKPLPWSRVPMLGLRQRKC
jgi:hypothetical protein